MTYDIEYKQGDKDTAGAVLSDDSGFMDLTGKTVVLIMKDTDTGLHRYEISCTLGGTYEGEYYSGARGGVTIPFTTTETELKGLFNGEFVVTGSETIVRVPSGDNYKEIMIWEKL